MEKDNNRMYSTAKSLHSILKSCPAEEREVIQYLLHETGDIYGCVKKYLLQFDLYNDFFVEL